MTKPLRKYFLLNFFADSPPPSFVFDELHYTFQLYRQKLKNHLKIDFWQTKYLSAKYL